MRGIWTTAMCLSDTGPRSPLAAGSSGLWTSNFGLPDLRSAFDEGGWSPDSLTTVVLPSSVVLLTKEDLTKEDSTKGVGLWTLDCIGISTRTIRLSDLLSSCGNVW